MGRNYGFNVRTMSAMMNKFTKSDGTSPIIAGIACIIIGGIFIYCAFKVFFFFFILAAFFIIFGLICLLLGLSQKKEILEYHKKLLTSGIAEIDKMKGVVFEDYLNELFKALGYRSQTTKYSGDYGADLILEKDEKIIVAQVKRYDKKITVTAIQEAVASRAYYGAREAWVITNNWFTEPAKNLASSNGVELIDRNKLMDLIIEFKSKNEISIVEAEMNIPAPQKIKLEIKKENN